MPLRLSARLRAGQGMISMLLDACAFPIGIAAFQHRQGALTLRFHFMLDGSTAHASRDVRRRHIASFRLFSAQYTEY